MKRALKYAIPFAALIAQGIDEPAHAGDLFLDIDGINGESNHVDHQDEIDILAWSWGVSNSVVFGGGGGGTAGKAEFTPIKIIKSVDAATNALVLQTVTGAPLNLATITAERTGLKGGNDAYMKIVLEDVWVTKVAHGGKDSENGTAETVTLDYEKVKVEYRKLLLNGNYGPWENVCWDRAANTGC